MNRPVLLALAFSTLAGAASAQYWRAMGLGPVGVTEIQTLYGDSVSDRLLAGGTFLHIMNEADTVLAYGQAAWNGTRWDSLAHRIAPAVGQTYWFLRFQGKLYSCGGYIFLTPGGEANASFARLNEETSYWEALECINEDFGGMLTLVPKAPSTTLYATGYTGSICGLPASCVFRYDGTAFHSWPPFEQIPPDNNNYVGTIFDYKGKTYLTGSFRDPVGPGLMATFLRWNGTAWEHVPGWNTQSPIKEILIHNDTLYVGGAFRFATGGPGNLIASFDGENWNDMGGGLSYPPVPNGATVLDLEWWHGELLASGRISKAGDASCTGIAKWDGHRWCSFAGSLHHASGIDAFVSEMAIWRDSLYICGDFSTIDGQPVRQVAQWIGGDAVGDCSTVGVSEPAAPPRNLVVNPLPVDGRWEVHVPGPGDWKVVACNAEGRTVASWRTSGAPLSVDLSTRAPGLYLLVATSAAGARYAAKVVRP